MSSKVMVKLKDSRSRELLNASLGEKKVRERLSPLRHHHAETYRHSIRVALLSLDLGLEFGFNSDELGMLAWAGLLHDIGKIKIPGEVLSKKSTLDAGEKELMDEHPRLGFLELHEPEFDSVRKVVIAHHEFKVNPYPRTGRERRRRRRSNTDRRTLRKTLNEFGQIVAVADIYDALVSRRTYKPPFTKPQVEKVLSEQFTGGVDFAVSVLQRSL